MSHGPIFLNNISVVSPAKTCFEDFSTTIYAGNRIALIGRNGTGKTSLLKILADRSDVSSVFVPQLIDGNTLSGGQRFNTALSEALAKHPDLLLLDEPTNHLDRHNRQSLMRMLRNFEGTLVIASHDVELLRTCVDTFWHFDQGKIHIFKGQYDDYKKDVQQKRKSIEEALARLDRQRKDTHQALMKEQERASKSKAHGEKKYADDKLTLRSAQARGQLTSNKYQKRIGQTKETLTDQLAELRLPEVILPRFALSAEDVGEKTIVEISNGSCGYNKTSILKNISLIMSTINRLAVVGSNGSGKSTLVKALRGDPEVWLWILGCSQI